MHPPTFRHYLSEKRRVRFYSPEKDGELLKRLDIKKQGFYKISSSVPVEAYEIDTI